MPSDPEELLRSIERTRQEVALTIDTIAGRLDPKLAARRGIGAVRSSVVDVVDGARVKLHLGQERRLANFPEGSQASSDDHRPSRLLASASGAARSAKSKVDAARPALRRVPMPAIGGGLAALLALAAVLAAVNRRRRR